MFSAPKKPHSMTRLDTVGLDSSPSQYVGQIVKLTRKVKELSAENSKLEKKVAEQDVEIGLKNNSIAISTEVMIIKTCFYLTCALDFLFVAFLTFL